MRLQDLLKCIHRFATEFYTERGQLLNISREYRKQRKKRTQKRARQRLRASREEGLNSLSDSSSSESSKSKEDSEEDPASNAETEQESDDDREEADLDSDDHGESPSTSEMSHYNTQRLSSHNPHHRRFPVPPPSSTDHLLAGPISYTPYQQNK